MQMSKQQQTKNQSQLVIKYL